VLWIYVRRHAADALGIPYLATVFRERAIAFLLADLIVGRPDGLCNAGHA